MKTILLLLSLTSCATLPEKFGACSNACEGNLQRYDNTTDSCVCYPKCREVNHAH